jgi:hypothetical protein
MLTWTSISLDEAIDGVTFCYHRIAKLSQADRLRMPICEFLDLLEADSLFDICFFVRWGISETAISSEIDTAQTVGDLCRIISRSSNKLLFDDDPKIIVQLLCVYFAQDNVFFSDETPLCQINQDLLLLIASVLWRSAGYDKFSIHINRCVGWCETTTHVVGGILAVAAVPLVFIFRPYSGVFYMIACQIIGLVLVCQRGFIRPIRVRIKGCRTWADLIALLRLSLHGKGELKESK